MRDRAAQIRHCAVGIRKSNMTLASYRVIWQFRWKINSLKLCEEKRDSGGFKDTVDQSILYFDAKASERDKPNPAPRAVAETTE